MSRRLMRLSTISRPSIPANPASWNYDSSAAYRPARFPRCWASRLLRLETIGWSQKPGCTGVWRDEPVNPELWAEIDRVLTAALTLDEHQRAARFDKRI